MPPRRSGLISFRRTDQFSIDLVDIVKDFAEHFKVKRNYIRQFCRLIQTSKKWDITNLNVKIEEWIKKFTINSSGREALVDLVRRAFQYCKTKKDIDELRGLLVESLIIAGHGGTVVLNDPEYGWGSKVFINNTVSGQRQIKYSCPTPNGTDCTDRHTVDFGVWNGYHGKFFECKAHPNSINCKEIKYMTNLKTELTNEGITHEVFFVCAEDTESIELRLKAAGCSPLYKAIGTKELEYRLY